MSRSLEVGLRDRGLPLDESNALARAISMLVEAYVTRARSVRVSETLETPSVAGVQGPGLAQWVTPPEASRRTGIPVRTIRMMIKKQVIQARLKNRPGKTKQPKFLVNVAEVARAASATRTSYPSGRMLVEGNSAATASADDWVQSRAASARGGER